MSIYFEETMSKKIGITLIVLLCAVLAACASFYPSHRDGVSSSLVSFLYPGGAMPDQERDETPNLKVPVTIGLAFVPTMSSGYPSGLPEALKNELLERVKASFKSRAYIREILIIPEIYL